MKINLRFILFVFGRYLLMVLGYGLSSSILTYLVLFKSANYSFLYSLIFTFSFIPVFCVLALPISFMASPYYDCDNGQHSLVIVGEYGQEVIKCRKCDYSKPVKYKKVSVLRRNFD